MRPEDVRKIIRREPFQPYRIYLSNGRTHDVHHPELVFVGKRELIVGQASPEDTEPIFDEFTFVNLLHINEIQALPKKTPPTPPSVNGPAA